MTLAFRPLDARDVDAVHAIVSDWNVVRQLASWPWPPDSDVTRARVTDPLPQGMFAEGAFEGDTLVGTYGVRHGNYGLMVAPDFHRRGFGRVIATRALDAAFGAGYDAVHADVWQDNVASHALHRGLGFHEVRRGLKHNLARGEDVVSVDYILTRAAWETRR